MIKSEFGSFGRCKLIIIANEKNVPEAVGGLLGLARIVVVSPESISMLSEAASSRKRVVTFSASSLSRKHRFLLDSFAEKGFLRLSDIGNMATAIGDAYVDKKGLSGLDNSVLIKQRLERML